MRLALGASPGQVRAAVLRETLTLVGIGVLAGVALVLPAGKAAGALLYGLSARDPCTLIIASASSLQPDWWSAPSPPALPCAWTRPQRSAPTNAYFSSARQRASGRVSGPGGVCYSAHPRVERSGWTYETPRSGQSASPAPAYASCRATLAAATAQAPHSIDAARGRSIRVAEYRQGTRGQVVARAVGKSRAASSRPCRPMDWSAPTSRSRLPKPKYDDLIKEAATGMDCQRR